MNGINQQRPTTPSQITTTGGHVVTIHTSSITSAAATLAATAPNSSTVAATIIAPTPTTSSNVVSPPHTGYTRRAKLGDSRSTGRLHSAGNTHRSMTRLNIAGKFYKCRLWWLKKRTISLSNIFLCSVGVTILATFCMFFHWRFV